MADVQLNYTGAQINTLLERINSIGDKNAILNMIYPIGSIYMSTNLVNPNVLFGGTWERIQDTFLLAAGSTYAAGSSGGEATHTLVVDEMPNHNHRSISNESGKEVWTGTGGTRIETGSGSTYGFNYGPDVLTGNTGGGQAHNNMPPYLAVYVWKRTA